MSDTNAALLERPVEDSSPVDCLDREPFVDRMIKICEICAASKKNICYAVNGEWGVGKSFVLDMFEKRISQYGQEGTVLDKYLVFHYNCWEYDYYEEPVVAIIAMMQEVIDENERLIPAEVKVQIKAIFKTLGDYFVEKLHVVNEVIEKTEKETTGVTHKGTAGLKLGCEGYEVVRDIHKNCRDAISEQHGFDKYFDFRAVRDSVRDSLKMIAEYKTIVLVVDELDRCLPEYAIKVLERLHHVFSGLQNVQVILSIDKGQLQHIVKQIYGSDTSTERYLAKFIDFELKLDKGILNEQAEERFSEYYAMFAHTEEESYLYDIESNVNEFKRIILSGIDARSRIAIINKCILLHTMLYGTEEKKCYLYMCLEIFSMILHFYHIEIRQESRYSFSDPFKMDGKRAYDGVDIPIPLREVLQKWEEEKTSYGEEFYNAVDRRTRISMETIWGVLLVGYHHMVCNRPMYSFGGSDDFEIRNVLKITDEIWETLQIIS